jgi:molybdopterin-guanine dinucleotide biosynthesis protein A
MGRDKAFIDIDGVPLVERAAMALSEAGAADIRITGGDVDRLAALGLTVDPDVVPHEGPLAALVASLERARHDPVVVLACDMPRVSAQAIGRVLDALGDADAVVPTDGDRRQWLHGAWRRRCLPVLRAAYHEGDRAIHRAITGLEVHTVEGIPPPVLADVDRPGDLLAASYPASVDIAEIDIDEFVRRRRQGAPVLDVRQSGEYDDAHVPGAVLVPLDQLPDRLRDVPTGDLLVICRSGHRSAKAVEFLSSQGRSATNVAGGTNRWIEAGHPVDRGAGSS